MQKTQLVHRTNKTRHRKNKITTKTKQIDKPQTHNVHHIKHILQNPKNAVAIQLLKLNRKKKQDCHTRTNVFYLKTS